MTQFDEIVKGKTDDEILWLLINHEVDYGTEGIFDFLKKIPNGNPDEINAVGINGSNYQQPYKVYIFKNIGLKISQKISYTPVLCGQYNRDDDDIIENGSIYKVFTSTYKKCEKDTMKSIEDWLNKCGVKIVQPV